MLRETKTSTVNKIDDRLTEYWRRFNVEFFQVIQIRFCSSLIRLERRMNFSIFSIQVLRIHLTFYRLKIYIKIVLIPSLRLHSNFYRLKSKSKLSHCLVSHPSPSIRRFIDTQSTSKLSQYLVLGPPFFHNWSYNFLLFFYLKFTVKMNLFLATVTCFE